jgi:hypothetical protein
MVAFGIARLPSPRRCGATVARPGVAGVCESDVAASGRVVAPDLTTEAGSAAVDCSVAAIIASVKTVRAAFAVEGVDILAADQKVVAAGAVNLVVAATAEDDVAAAVAAQDIVVGPAGAFQLAGVGGHDRRLPAETPRQRRSTWVRSPSSPQAL